MIDDIRSRGISVECYDGPAVRLPARWPWMAIVLVVGFTSVVTTSRLRGRNTDPVLLAGIVVVVLSFFVAMHIRRVKVLRRTARHGVDIIGYTLGGYEVVGLLTGAGVATPGRLVRTNVVGVFAEDDSVAIVIDQDGGTPVRSSDSIGIGIAERGGRCWLTLRTTDENMALRIRPIG